MYEVTLWPILAASISNLIIGFIWYSPKVFGTVWMNLAGVTPEAMEKGKKRMPIMVIASLVAAAIMAYVMAHFGIAWGVFDWIGGVELAFWLWLGFIVPAMLGIVLWEGKPLKLYFINIGYWFLSMVAMGVILSL